MGKWHLVMVTVVVFIVLSTFWFYNTVVRQDRMLVSLSTQANEIATQIEELYTNKMQTITLMQEIVKRYALYDSWVVEQWELRKEQTKNLTTLEMMIASWQTQTSPFSSLLTHTWESINQIVEKYPIYTTDQYIVAIHNTLKNIENINEYEFRLKQIIKDYNDGVTEFNLRIRSFPRWVLISKIAGFEQKGYFTIFKN